MHRPICCPNCGLHVTAPVPEPGLETGLSLAHCSTCGRTFLVHLP